MNKHDCFQHYYISLMRHHKQDCVQEFGNTEAKSSKSASANFPPKKCFDSHQDSV